MTEVYGAVTTKVWGYAASQIWYHLHQTVSYKGYLLICNELQYPAETDARSQVRLQIVEDLRNE